MMSSKKLIKIFPFMLFFSAHIKPAGIIANLPCVHGFFSKLVADHKAGTAKVLSNPKFFKFKKKPFKPNWAAYDMRRALLAKHFVQQDGEQFVLTIRPVQPVDKAYEKSLKHALEVSKKKNWMALATLTLPYQKPVSEEERKRHLQEAIQKYAPAKTSSVATGNAA